MIESARIRGSKRSCRKLRNLKPNKCSEFKRDKKEWKKIRKVKTLQSQTTCVVRSPLYRGSIAMSKRL